MVHPVYADLPTTIFEEMSGLARQTGAINLGQGFPDDAGPDGRCGRRPARRCSPALTSIRRCAACPPCARPWPRTMAAPRAWTWTGRARSSSPPARPRPWRRRS